MHSSVKFVSIFHKVQKGADNSKAKKKKKKKKKKRKQELTASFITHGLDKIILSLKILLIYPKWL